jgi:hypothetical protein
MTGWLMQDKIGINVEGSGCGLFQGSQEKPVKIVGVSTEIRNVHLPNISQDVYRVN